MAIHVGDVSMYVGPHTLGPGLDNLETVIVDFIDGARKRLDIAVQELDHEPIARAIIAAKQRGVTVRLVLEQDYLKSRRASSDPFIPSGGNEENRRLHDAILRSSILVWSDFNPAIFHQKFMVRDGSAVLTGSTNFTTTGVTKNLNHIVVVKSRKAANIFESEFGEIRQGHFGKQDEGHDPKPDEFSVSDVAVKIAFAPDHGPEMEIMKQMLKAKRRVDFAIFTFAESSGIDDTMIALRRDRQFQVRGAMDGKAANQRWAAKPGLQAAGAKLWTVPSTSHLGKLHHKLMVIDDEVTIVGSFNYTRPANRTNDENIMILGHAGATGAERTAQRRIARFARAEIDRIIADHGVPV